MSIFSVVLASLFALTVFSGLAPAYAQVSPEVEARMAALINQKKFDDAREVLAASNPNRAEQLLFEGRVKKRSGDQVGAIKALEQALRLQPYDLRIRRELAHSLITTGKLSKAAYHFDRLLATDTDPRFRAAYQQFRSQISKQRPVEWDVFFSIVPSTNVNRGTAALSFSTLLGDFDIDGTSQSTSGIGATLGVGAAVNLQTTPKHRTRLNFRLNQTKYSTDGSFDFASATVSLPHRRENGRVTLQIAPFAKREWREDGNDLEAAGLSFDARVRAQRDLWLNIGASSEKRDFPNVATKNGWRHLLRLGVERQLSPDLVISAGLQFEDQGAQAAHLAYDGQILTLGAAKSWPTGLVLRGNIFAGTRDFDGDFPLTDTARADDLVGLSVSATINSWHIAGFSPIMNCRYEKNRSNIALFEYDSVDCGLRFSRRF